ncbi:MAG: hypothetical protein J6B70_08500 [Oscillospiraceae bacterium]|nr:hypothetical protein [Oscillospiraceae bacterium]
MSKRIIAFLVTIALVMSMLPLAALAEETVTPDEVGEAIDQAQLSALKAGVANGLSGEVQTAVDEALAAANEQLAENKLNDAESIVEGTNADNAERAEKAEDAAEDAAAAADKAAEDAAAAADAEKAAEDALDAAKGTNSKDKAEHAAEKAEEASAAADQAAADAQVQSAVAAQKAQDAKDAYEAAKKAAEEADAEAKALLDLGVEDLEAAQAKAAEAAKRAQDKYDEMVAAEKAAEEAANSAKADADAAKEELDKAAADLEQAIKDNTVNVAEKTATTVVTGAALAASKVAVDAAGKVVDYYQGELDDLQAQVEELDAAIAGADAAIADAQAKLDALDKEDAEYPQAKKALEEAQAAKDKAQNIKNNAQTILDAKKEAEEEGKAQQMKDLQAAVADGTATAEQKQQLTEQVLGDKLSENELGKITWVEGKDDIFYVEEADGNKTYYEVKTDVKTELDEEGNVVKETNYLQYYKTELVTETEVDSIPGAEEEYNKNQGTTVYKAYDENQNAYAIKVVRTGFGSKWSPYEYTYVVDTGKVFGVLLKSDAEGFYITVPTTSYPFTKEIRLAVVDTTLSHFETEDTAIGTNSNTITDKWAEAEKAEENLAEKEQALKDATDKFNAAEKTYNETKDTLEGIKTENGEIKVAKQEEVNALNQQIGELDKKLNGDLADQLLRGVIQIAIGEDPDVTVTDVVTRRIQLEAKKALANLPFGGGEPLTEDEEKELEKLQSVNVDNITNSGKEMLNVIAGLQDGVDLEDVKNTINLLANSGVSAKTREAILKAVEKTLDAVHEKAVEDLNKAIEDAKKKLTEKGQAVDAAAKEYADKELIFLEAAAKEKLAEQAVNNAANLKDLAVKAQKDAEAALKAYEELAGSYETDKSLVEAAKKAYEDASKKADEALAAANAAIKNAIAAAQAALEARKIANTFPEEDEYIEPTYRNLGLTIARYAYSLVGPLMPGFSENNDAMTNAEFVRLVYARFGIKLDLSSTRPEDVAKNGVRIDNTMVKPGDLVCIHADNGMVGTFGIYYGQDIYVFFNETTREVELGDCAHISNSWFVVRVVQ